MKYNSDKIFILFIVAIIIISAFLYKSYSINLQEEKEVINAQLIKEKEIIKEKEEIENNKKQETENITKMKLKSQLDYFDSIFENVLIDAHINCGWLAEHNNAILRNDSEIKKDFTNSLEIDKSNCRNKLAEIPIKNKFIAEPELIKLRKKLSEFIQITTDLALYALEGGGQAEIMNDYERDLRKLRTEIREEIIIARRLNDL